ncbi:hypothetical protein ACIGEP_13165 [Microbacterium sp. NPDC077663]|uniref:hypothetical protein n=1 Tax=Microbacterium sp. NPDC077663 TaxID=3364189 RepID=UPI0037C77A97
MFVIALYGSRILMVVSFLAAGGVLYLLHQTGNTEAFNVVLGVVIGAAATTLPQAFARHTDRLLRARAAARLVRSDLYAHQDWILQSVLGKSWVAPPTEMATLEHYAELAYVTGRWKKWEPLSASRRFIAQLLGDQDTWTPEEFIHHATEAIKAIDRARAALSKIDGGGKEPRLETKRFEAVRKAAEAAPLARVPAHRPRRPRPSIGALFRRR